MKKTTSRKNKAQFPATKKPQQVKMLVRDIDSGQQGVVLGKVAGGFVKVKWDGRSKPTLIQPDQLSKKANPKRKRYTFKKANPDYVVEAAPQISRQRIRVKAATDGGAVKKVKRMMGGGGKALAFKYSVERNPKTRAAAKSPRGSKPNPQQKFSKSSLDHLRKQFAAIDGVRIAKHRPQFDRVFAATSRPLLKQLASAKPPIEWVSAQAKDYLVARRNPAGKKRNIGLGDFANVAVILGGLDSVRKLMATTKKKREKKKVASKKKQNSPRAGASAKVSKKRTNIGLVDLAANLQAAEFLSKALSGKKKKRNTKSVTSRRGKSAVSGRQKSAKSPRPNPNNGRIFQEFTGSPSTKVTNGFMAHKSEPTNVDQLGTLTEIKLANLNSGPILRFPIGVKRVNGKRVLVFSNMLMDERGKAINPKRIHKLANPSVLCAKELGNGRRRFVVASKQPFFLQNGAHEKKAHNYGLAVQISYRAPKPHLYDGDTRPHEHYHNLGEEGGRQPLLKLDNGWLRFHGGDYKIREEGIRD